MEPVSNNNARAPIRAVKIGAQAVGALAVGALAMGALAVGAVTIGRLVIGRSRIRRLEIDELVVGRLHVIDSSTAPGTAVVKNDGAKKQEIKYFNHPRPLIRRSTSSSGFSLGSG